MATIIDMVKNRLPDEATLFNASLPVVVEEAQALAGYEGIPEAELSTTRKSLIADLAAKALLLPARSHYKKEMSKVEGDGAGRAEFVDKLKFLDTMETALTRSIAERRQGIQPADTGVAMIVME
ncbi:hypothetical protein [Geobacter sp. SVR]|uniref:hypothetical protein n=1 Tax=Geobacter sp. SVR TaxID=2495594 RepID=UPI00143EFD83|nr:hypothetical protein [Geobacter sp. SVR]BCS55191.1 hypothetical protein GSVR_34990 [Geobacter sp. SVR]GCF85992.1 hypothetical protein GSbR_25920 [Geobacter sp. SVR]